MSHEQPLTEFPAETSLDGPPLSTFFPARWPSAVHQSDSLRSAYGILGISNLQLQTLPQPSGEQVPKANRQHGHVYHRQPSSLVPTSQAFHLPQGYDKTPDNNNLSNEGFSLVCTPLW